MRSAIRNLASLTRRAALRYAAYLEGRPLATEEWCEPGCFALLLVPVVIAVAFSVSGPIRVVLGCSLGVALPFAFVATAIVVGPIVAGLRAATTRPFGRGAYLWQLLLAIFSVLVLYRRVFAGLTNYVGADGGGHIIQQNLFVQRSPGVYLGFVSMYALMHWAEVIARINSFWALCFAFYFGVAVVAIIPMIIATAALAPFTTPRARSVGLAGAGVAALLIAFFVVLPQQHYHQTDGFFVHLFGLVPLSLMWLVDTVVRARAWRWLAFVAGAVLYRYTYGLNLADLLLSVAVVLFVDSFGAGVPRVARWILRLSLLLFATAAVLFLVRLDPLLRSYGWIISYFIRVVTHAQALAIAVMTIALIAAATRSSSVAVRAMRFPIAFSVINLALVEVGLSLPGREPYYILKYPIHAVMLCAGALVVVAGLVCAELAERSSQPRRARRALYSVALVALGTATVVEWTKGFAPFQPTFHERIAGHEPFTFSRPAADLGAWSRIERVLRTEHKDFAGYITWYWPMFNFMNGAFGNYGGRPLWDAGDIVVARGQCVFWDDRPVDSWNRIDDLPQTLRTRLRLLKSEGDATCASYRAPWHHALERRLCHLCR